MLPVAMIRSFSGSVVIHYVLPVLWMTSYLLKSQKPTLLDIAAQLKRMHTQPWAWL